MNRGSEGVHVCVCVRGREGGRGERGKVRRKEEKEKVAEEEKVRQTLRKFLTLSGS